MPYLHIFQDSASELGAKSIFVFIERSTSSANQSRAPGRSGMEVCESGRTVEDPRHERQCLAISAIRNGIQGVFDEHMPRP